MIELEDLPRLESLSPIRDIGYNYQRNSTSPATTITPSTSINDISCKSNNNFMNNMNKKITDNSWTNPRFNGSGLRYISQQHCGLHLYERHQQKSFYYNTLC